MNDKLKALALELRELMAKATPGPWEVLGDNQGHPAGLEWTIEAPQFANEEDTGWVAGRHGGDGIASTGNPGCRADAELIVAAVNALPLLLNALAATLAPLGDKDREAVAVLAMARDYIETDESRESLTDLIKFDAAAQHIATRLAESVGGEVYGWVAPSTGRYFKPAEIAATEQNCAFIEQGKLVRVYTTPPAAAVECTAHDTGWWQCHCDRCRKLPTPPTPSAGVSDEKVEAAADAMSQHDDFEFSRPYYEGLARAALAAAEGVRHD